MSGRSSLLKQLLGAGVGSLVALGVYTAYEILEPSMTALLVLPSGSNSTDTNLDHSDPEYERQLQQNREISEHFSAPDDPFSGIADRANEIQDGLTEEERAAIEAALEETEGSDQVVDPAPTTEIDIPVETVEEPFPVEEQYVPPAPPYEASVTSVNADSLPSSGLGLWLAGAVTFALAAFIHRRRLIAALQAK
jgi:uncharacterized protein YhaN